MPRLNAEAKQPGAQHSGDAECYTTATTDSTWIEQDRVEMYLCLLMLNVQECRLLTFHLLLAVQTCLVPAKILFSFSLFQSTGDYKWVMTGNN